MRAENSLFTCCQVDPKGPCVNPRIDTHVANSLGSPCHPTIHARCESLIVVGTEADIDDWSSVLELLDELGISLIIVTRYLV